LQAADVVFFNAGGLCTNAQPLFSGIQLTTTWTVAAAADTTGPRLCASSIYGVFTAIRYNDTAQLAFCDLISGIDVNSAFAPNTGTKRDASSGVRTAGCSADLNIWGVGLRTIWNPVANLDIRLEVFRDELDPKIDKNLWHTNFGGGGGQPSGQYRPDNLGVWGAILRVQRNFYP
jgi:Porin subfamily